MRHARAVTDFYFDHADDLAPAKRFHFASRMAAWTGDARARALLAECRADIVPEPVTPATLTSVFRTLAAIPFSSDMHIPAYTQRKPYFERFAPLFGLELALFRLRHLETAYNIRARASFTDAINPDVLLELEQRILSDGQAVRTLSTYAVNYTYLLHRILLEEAATGVDPALFYKLGKAYEPRNPESLRLLIYLYTHCIVAESNLYVRSLPAKLLPVYTDMLRELESLISDNYDSVSLDAKLEFLVCCRICDYDTPLFQKVHAECQHSLGPEGAFIIDVHNSFTGVAAKRTFNGSEHRNVLYIMSTTAYQPRPL